MTVHVLLSDLTTTIAIYIYWGIQPNLFHKPESALPGLLIKSAYATRIGREVLTPKPGILRHLRAVLCCHSPQRPAWRPAVASTITVDQTGCGLGLRQWKPGGIAQERGIFRLLCRR